MSLSDHKWIISSCALRAPVFCAAILNLSHVPVDTLTSTYENTTYRFPSREMSSADSLRLLFRWERTSKVHTIMFDRWASAHFVFCRVVLCCIPKLSKGNDGSIYLYISGETYRRKERLSTRQVCTNFYASEVCSFEPNPRHMLTVRTKRVTSRSQTPEAADEIENGTGKHPRYDKTKGRAEAAIANLT